MKDFVATGNATEAALRNYNVKDRVVAKSVGSELLSFPAVKKAIEIKQKTLADALPDELLTEKHLALLNKKEVIVRNNVTSGEIETIPTGEIDSQAVAKGLDMAYKVKGTYAPEKSQALNINIDAGNMANPKIEALKDEYREKLKAILTK